jgi:hypothetical protein
VDVSIFVFFVHIPRGVRKMQHLGMDSDPAAARETSARER